MLGMSLMRGGVRTKFFAFPILVLVNTHPPRNCSRWIRVGVNDVVAEPAKPPRSLTSTLARVVCARPNGTVGCFVCEVDRRPVRGVGQDPVEFGGVAQSPQLKATWES